MKHTKNITIALPAKAESSILETGQKVTVGGNIVTVFTNLIAGLDKLRLFLDALREDEETE